MRLASFGPMAGTQGAAAIAARQAGEIEPRQRQQAAGARTEAQALVEKNSQQPAYAGGERTQAPRRGARHSG